MVYSIESPAVETTQARLYIAANNTTGVVSQSGSYKSTVKHSSGKPKINQDVITQVTVNDLQFIFPLNAKLCVFRDLDLLYVSKFSPRTVARRGQGNYKNSNRNVQLCNGHLYYLSESQDIIKITVTPPFVESEVQHTWGLKVEDFVVENDKVVLLTRLGEVKDIAYERKVKLGPDVEFWTCLHKLHNRYVATGWSKTQKINMVYFLTPLLAVVHSLSVSCGEANEPYLWVGSAQRGDHIYLICARAFHVVDLIAVYQQKDRLVYLGTQKVTGKRDCRVEVYSRGKYWVHDCY